VKRLRVMAEAQPIDPVLPSVLVIDSRESESRPSTHRATAVRVNTASKNPHGNVRDVNVVVLCERWTYESLASEIALNVLAAADAAGLKVDADDLQARAMAAARRELGVIGRVRRWFA
jgi:hypothetical protein